jgi:hypothetical protein
VLSRRIGAPDGYELALVTTDLAATPAQVIERYADRWSEEQAFFDGKHLAASAKPAPAPAARWSAWSPSVFAA